MTGRDVASIVVIAIGMAPTLFCFLAGVPSGWFSAFVDCC